MDLISIVVPVYNTERYLSRCIGSILSQSYTNFEVLLIDDGSKDNSSKICDEYASKDQRIKVVHTENKGVSKARNLGILHSKGMWICFIDSDDFVEYNYLAAFLKCDLKSCDYIVQDFEISGYKTKKWFRVLSKGKYDIKDRKIVSDLFLYGVPWGKLYKLSILKDNDILFDVKLSIHEDHVFVLTYLQYVKTFEVTNNKGYKYCINDEPSLTRNDKIYDADQLLYAYNKLIMLSDNIIAKYDLPNCISGFHTFCIKILIQSYISSVYYGSEKCCYILHMLKNNIKRYRPNTVKGLLIKMFLLILPEKCILSLSLFLKRITN